MSYTQTYGQNVRDSVFRAISGITGHSIKDIDNDTYLESDLGLDSIKTVSLMTELMKLVPEEQSGRFSEKYPVSYLMSLETVGAITEVFEEWSRSPDAGERERSLEAKAAEKPACTVTACGIAESVLEKIAGITGHNASQIENDMFLESDLGIDSIKMVSLMNELIKLIPEDELDSFTSKYPVSSLMTFQTVGEIIDAFGEWVQCHNKSMPKNRELSGSGLPREAEKLEMVNAQYPFLAAYMAVSNITIVSGVCIRGTLDEKALWDSWREVIARNPVLRAVFAAGQKAKSFGDYSMILLGDATPPAIDIEDVRHLDEQHKRAFVKKRMEDIINSKFDIFNWPLHNLQAVYLENDKYEIILSANHTISDGLGNHKIIGELMSIYASKTGNTPLKLPQPLMPSDFNDIARQINNWSDENENRELYNYLKKQGKEKYFFNPYGAGKSLPQGSFKGVVTCTKKYRLDEETVNSLLSCTSVFNASLFVIIVSAYIRTIKQQEHDKNDMILNLPTGGRVYPNADATGVAGCFAQNLALSFETAGACGDWATLIDSVKETINHAIAWGIDRAQALQTAKMTVGQDMLENGKMTEMSSAFIRAAIKSNLYLSFTGNTYLEECCGKLELYDYEAYTCTNPGTIDNLVEIFKGQIFITSNYDGGFFDEAYIDMLMGKFLENIRQVAYEGSKHAYRPQKQAEHVSCDMQNTLIRLFEEVCGRKACSADLQKALDAELGMDSLQRIRMVSLLSREYEINDKGILLGAGTLAEMGAAIEKAHGSTAGENALEDGEEDYEIQIPFMKIVQQCRLTPDAPAIVFEDSTISYGALKDITNRLANFLKARGIGRGAFVGIMALPGPNMLIGMLAILKCGAAYIPVDPSYPSERIQYILNHSKVSVILTEHILREQLAPLFEKTGDLKLVAYLDGGDRALSLPKISQVMRGEWIGQASDEPLYSSEADDLMTVLYTSGSTGNPKGVMLAHRGYMNRLKWHQDTFSVRPGERVAQKTSCCFDISVWELFWPLMYGGTVCPVRKETLKNPWKLARWIADAKISIMHFVPSLFGEFINAIEGDSYDFSGLRWLIFSGEALPMSYIQKWIDRNGMSAGLANLYGPTEASIDVTCHIINKRPGEDGETRIPIGKPISGVFIKNLDKNMRELPKGDIGELWIGGVQLAKGYLNDAEKTSACFIANPFKDIPGQYIYRTGDLTSENADGSYEYHGRIDNQVKIRGFRIELGEIEAVLCSVPGVDEAAVLAVGEDDDRKQLMAWLSGRRADDMEIKNVAAKKLPDYMIPHRIEWMDCLPKTANGKLDRKALEHTALKKSGVSCASGGEEMGGDKQLKMKTAEGSLMPLSPAQSWIMSFFSYPYAWSGYTRFLYKQPLDLKAFNMAVNELLDRHDSLRCVFVRKDFKWYQKVLPKGMPVEVRFYDACHMDENERNTAVRDMISQEAKELRIDRWPLIRIAAVKVSDDVFDISVIGHHLISDMITNGLLFKEMWKIYRNILEGTGAASVKPVPSYMDFVQLVEQERKDNLEVYTKYWKEQFPTQMPVFGVPMDLSGGSNNEASAAMESFTLERSGTSVLLGRAKKHFSSNVYPILLAPLYKALSKSCKGERVIVSHRMHGRDLGKGRTFFDTPGNFAINFPLPVSVGENDTWQRLVDKIRDGLDKTPLNGISYDLAAESLPAYMYPDERLTAVRANYLGNRDLMGEGVFGFTKEDSDRRLSDPDQKRISVLEVFFSICNGSLTVELEYSKNYYSQDVISRIGNEYMEELKQMLLLVEAEELRPIKVPGEYRRASGNLTGRVAVVTGGGRGLGRAIALSMAREGANIAVIGRTMSSLQKTADEIMRTGAEVIALSADVSDYNSVVRAVNRIVERFGRIDILINNAGITKMVSVMDSNPEEWQSIVKVNLFGSYNFCRAVVPHMVKQSAGKIINIGSDSSFIGYPLMSAYAASKHGILGITRSMSEELKHQNIQVNAVCPSFVDTGMAPAAFRDKAMHPEKVADTVVFLASSKSDCISGEALKVYGKQDMYWFGSKQASLFNQVLKG
ncbi:amino acid adenylation domain-containing protein [Anaerobacterium chartisolvens]|uniref:Amino acid adenylation domain-containing protein n=1 Tax=Anaerobacterium chartisolvens TaxID=1297424 RepID=A0A369AN23_9FIRM|nr:non-ribosomal peptide synthetase [Anaerobacterium chartisolvens]RCX09587.1 amino acid adenylation domain-containing protein [Anaerobacterium chartisolvens]